ncbi:MAG: hypothetical protein WC964_00950 [Acholeplasmataceae bacterium]
MKRFLYSILTILSLITFIIVVIELIISLSSDGGSLIGIGGVVFGTITVLYFILLYSIYGIRDDELK